MTPASASLPRNKAAAEDMIKLLKLVQTAPIMLGTK